MIVTIQRIFQIGMILLILSFTGCDDATTSASNSTSEMEDGSTRADQDADEIPDVETADTDPKSDNRGDGVTIEGKNVNVRAKASVTGKVVAQVNGGETYKQAAMSDFFETIGKQTDFWYKINLGEGQEGWVFGAFTNAKLSANPRTDRLKFEGVAMGDYYHLNFSWPGGRGFGWKCPQYYMEPEGFCDFGYGGPHELSGYELELEVDDSEYMELVPNPKYHQKMFDVTWKVLLGDAVKGEGSMETIEMETPQILAIKLVEK